MPYLPRKRKVKVWKIGDGAAVVGSLKEEVLGILDITLGYLAEPREIRMGACIGAQDL
jgi:hypothetical protein